MLNHLQFEVFLSYIGIKQACLPIRLAAEEISNCFIDDGGMSKQYLDKTLKRLLQNNLSFKGVLEEEELKDEICALDTFSFIFMHLGHYVFVYVTPSHFLYLDSLGEGIRTRFNKKFNKFVTKCYKNYPNRTFHINRRKLQPDSSVACGLYCALFTLYFVNKSHEKLTFQTNNKTNDKRLTTYIINEIMK